MTLLETFEAEGIEIDDIRWYLAIQEAARLLTYSEEADSLAKIIHSGKLEADWYRMEDRFIEDLDEKLEQRLTDKSEIQKIIGEIEFSRSMRDRS